jgi:hypothetical protein
MVLICWIDDEELQGKDRALRDFYINEVLRDEGFNLDRMVLSGRSKMRGASWFAQKRYQHEAADARKIAGHVDYIQGEEEL